MAEPAQVKILHLLPHAGGGVGTVLRAIIGRSAKYGEFRHAVATLESLNSRTKMWCVENKISFFENSWGAEVELLNLINDCDILHIHWWNHPLLQALMRSFPFPEMRAVLWAHVNGLFVPQIFFQSLIDFPDFFVLSTPYSAESPLVISASEQVPNKIRIIQSSAGMPVGIPEKITKPEQFRAGYIGTVDYSKMHRDFIAIWTATGIADAPLLVCGGLAEEKFRQEVASRGVAHLFDIRGVVDNAFELLSELHVFMYPLAGNHYGTGEQVLLEAMAFGAVPVVMNNGCERSLVKDGETGLVASGKEEFVRAILYLRDNPQIRQKMAEMGRQHVSEQFGLEKTVHNWHELYNELSRHKKKQHRMTLFPMGNLPIDTTTTLLLNSYGNSLETQKILALLEMDTSSDGWQEGLLDLPDACFSKTRGSPFHYRNFLPSDPSLEKICNALASVTVNEPRDIL